MIGCLLRCRYVSNPEDISVIQDVPTKIEIDMVINSFANLKNSFDDDLNNETFEHDDYYCKNSDTNFTSVCDES